MRGDHLAVLVGQTGGQRHRPVDHVGLGRDGIGDAGLDGVGPAVAATGQGRVAQRGRRQVGGDHGEHRGRERQAEVDLGQAPVAAILPHDQVIVGRGQHGPTGERVAVHGRDGDRGEAQDASEQSMDVVDEAGAGVARTAEPVEVESVRVELPGSGGHQRDGPLGRLDFVERRVQGVDRLTVEPVLALVHPQQCHPVLPLDPDHAATLTRAISHYLLPVADYRPPLRDVSFVLDHLVDIEGLFRLEPFAHLDAATVQGVLEENAKFVSEVIAPLNRVGDLQGSQHLPDNTVRTPDGFKDAYAAYVAAGWNSVPFEPGYGGGGFPWLVGIVLQEFMSSANMAFSQCPLLTQGAIDILRHHADETLQQTYLPRMVSGEWTGTMNLTEPEAGSDVGALRTKAEPADDGTWRITGTKIFITFGEHDMADNISTWCWPARPTRRPAPRASRCFIVPKFLVDDDGSIGARNDVTCLSIEHKMGIKASPTCVMSYGEAGGAIGYLIGEQNQGMRYMFTMMNNARLSVGLEGLALGERAYQDALAYAQERQQGRAPGRPPVRAPPSSSTPTCVGCCSRCGPTSRRCAR